MAIDDENLVVYWPLWLNERLCDRAAILARLKPEYLFDELNIFSLRGDSP